MFKGIPYTNNKNINYQNLVFFQNPKLIGTTREIITDYQKQAQHIIELEKMAYYDHLTGVFNRHGQEYKMRKYFKNNEHISLIAVDIMNLGEINNKYGYLTGDEVIKNTSNILKKYFRWENKPVTDIILKQRKNKEKNNDIITRIGGDEFSIIINKLDEKIIEDRLKQIKKEVEMINSKTKYHFELHIGYNNDYKIDNFQIANEKIFNRLKSRILKDI